MITISVNGKEKHFEAAISVDELLNKLNIKSSRLAVERNLSIVPRTKYTETILENGDKIEIVSLVGGG